MFLCSPLTFKRIIIFIHDIIEDCRVNLREVKAVLVCFVETTVGKISSIHNQVLPVHVMATGEKKV